MSKKKCKCHCHTHECNAHSLFTCMDGDCQQKDAGKDIAAPTKQQNDAGKELEKTLIKIIYPNHGGEIPDWGDVQSHELNDILKLFKQRETHNEGR